MPQPEVGNDESNSGHAKEDRRLGELELPEAVARVVSDHGAHVEVAQAAIDERGVGERSTDGDR